MLFLNQLSSLRYQFMSLNILIRLKKNEFFQKFPNNFNLNSFFINFPREERRECLFYDYITKVLVYICFNVYFLVVIFVVQWRKPTRKRVENRGRLLFTELILLVLCRENSVRRKPKDQNVALYFILVCPPPMSVLNVLKFFPLFLSITWRHV